MIFPMFKNVQDEQREQALPMAKEIAWDFEKNIPIFEGGNPKIVSGAQAVLVWAYKALQVERARYPIYTWDYGNEAIQLINSDFSENLKKSEAQRFLKECLEVSPYIEEVKDIQVNFTDKRLNVSCKIITIYGEVSFNV